MAVQKPTFRLIAILFAFIFGGAIVGETVALSLVVSVAGSDALSKLYLINGSLLLLLPPLFFRNIDRVNRGKLLSGALLISCGALGFLLLGLQLGADNPIGALFFRAMYPFSYLSKTILFLTFWTLANDCYNTGEAKRGFPKVAAWGFVGALAGACVARILLEVVDPKTIIAIWALAYFVGFLLARNVTVQFRGRLLVKEQIRFDMRGSKKVFQEVEDVLSIKLVRLISALYFLVFVAVFSVDYLFWQRCHQWFTTTSSLASFQFSFYLTHGVITIAGLWFLMPRLIRRLGFPRIFSFLPITLFGGALMVLVFEQSGFLRERALFFAFAGFQLLRHVMFENAFSPIYQMFFASVSRDKRGRAKTMLEGVIKPAAIISAGAVLLILPKAPYGIPLTVILVSAAMIYIVTRVRKTYMEGLIPDLRQDFQPSEILAQIGSRYDQKILSLVRSYSQSRDADLRALAVKILAHLGTRQALKIIREIFENERDEAVREMVARSLTNFYWYDTRQFIDRLLGDPNSRLRANAIHSLNGMNCAWKWRLRDAVRTSLFEHDMRVQIEAAQYLWQTGDPSERKIVDAFLCGLLGSKNANKRSAGLFLIGRIRPQGWEGTLLENLSSSSMQVFTKSIEVILRSATRPTRLEALKKVETMSRKHVSVTGKAVQQNGAAAFETAIAFLEIAANRRMIFEMVHALRIILAESGKKANQYDLGALTARRITQWVFEELESVYRDGVVWSAYLARSSDAEMKCGRMLDDALRQQLFRAGEWALDALAILERRGMVAWGRRDLDLNDRTERSDMVEIVESYGPSKLGSLIIPILEFESWERIAKIGKHVFNFSDESISAADIGGFIQSSNKWVCLCALYCASRIPRRHARTDSENRRIERLRSDSNVYLARAATLFMSAGDLSNEEDGVNTFDLLETVLFFKKSPLFRNVPAEKLMGLAEISTLVSYRRDMVISSEGEISEHLYIVKSGSLKIVKVKNAVRTILSIIRPGEAYGEIGLFNQAPRSASSIANEDCEVFVIQRHALKKLLMEIPEIAFNFLEVFSEKLRRSGEEVALLHTTLSTQFGKDVSIGTREESLT